MKNFPAALPSIFPTMPMRWWSDGVVMLAPTIPLVSMMSLHVPSLPHEKRAATFDGALAFCSCVQTIAADHAVARVLYPCRCPRCAEWRPLFAADPWGPRLLPFVVRVGHA